MKPEIVNVAEWRQQIDELQSENQRLSAIVKEQQRDRNQREALALALLEVDAARSQLQFALDGLAAAIVS